MLIFAVSSADTQAAALIGGCLVAIVFLAVAFKALDVDPFSPTSVIRSLLQIPSWTELFVAIVMILLAVGAYRLIAFTRPAAEWITGHTQGDVNLTTALLMAILGLLVSVLILGVETFGMKRLMQRQVDGAGGDKEQAVAVARRSRAYWVEASITISLSVVALVPAALLANWAWNVLASVLLPVFLLSARHVHVNGGAET